MPGQTPGQVQQVAIAGQETHQPLKDVELLQQQQIHQQQLAQLIQQQGLQTGNIVVKMTEVQSVSSVGK